MGLLRLAWVTFVILVFGGTQEAPVQAVLLLSLFDLRPAAGDSMKCTCPSLETPRITSHLPWRAARMQLYR